MAKKILLADDSVTIQKVVELTFAESDFSVTSVSDGISALKKFNEIAPDVVLLDIYMPHMDGYQVCQKIKTDPKTKHIPVLLLTGTFESFDEDKAKQAMADGYLTKPFESTELITRVESLAQKSVAAGQSATEPHEVTKADAGPAVVDFELPPTESEDFLEAPEKSDDAIDEPLFEATEEADADIFPEDEEDSAKSALDDDEPIFDTGEEDEFLSEEEEKIFGTDDDLALAKDVPAADDDYLWETPDSESKEPPVSEVSHVSDDGFDLPDDTESSETSDDFIFSDGPAQASDSAEENDEELWEEPAAENESTPVSEDDADQGISFDDGLNDDSADGLWTETTPESAQTPEQTDELFSEAAEMGPAAEATPAQESSSADFIFEDTSETGPSPEVSFSDDTADGEKSQPEWTENETEDESEPVFDTSPDIEPVTPSIDTEHDFTSSDASDQLETQAEPAFEEFSASDDAAIAHIPDKDDRDFLSDNGPLPEKEPSFDLAPEPEDLAEEPLYAAAPEEEQTPELSEPVTDSDDQPEIESDTPEVTAFPKQTLQYLSAPVSAPVSAPTISADDFQRIVAEQLEALLTQHQEIIVEQVAEKMANKLSQAIAAKIVDKIGVGSVPGKAKAVLEEIAWEVVPDLAQVIIQKEIETIKSQMS